MDDEVRAPDQDAWFGVDLSIRHYVHSLEVRLNNLAARLELVELIHRDELERTDREIAKREARIQALEREVALRREKVERVAAAGWWRCGTLDAVNNPLG